MNSAYGIPVRDEASLSGGQAVEQLFKTPAGKFDAMYWTNWGTGTHYVNFGGAIGSCWANNGNFRTGGVDTRNATVTPHPKRPAPTAVATKNSSTA